MKYLLDTNAVIAVLRGDPGVIDRLKRERPDDFALSAIVGHELFFGAYKGLSTSENLARIEGLRFPMLDFDSDDARASGEIRAALSAAGEPIGPYDVLIAGQAVARSLILITRNTREFARVPALKVENWQD